MITVLEILAAIALIAQALIGLSFFISCIWEDENRAALFAGLQFAGMLVLLVLFFYLSRIGFFDTVGGSALLIISAVAGGIAVYALVLKRHPNPKALKGAEGHIVGPVERFDERETVFSRNHAMRPGSEQYRTFYADHPESIRSGSIPKGARYFTKTGKTGENR